MAWQRLSQRMSGAKPDGPYEGVPLHLQGALAEWLQRALFSIDITRFIGLRLRIPIPHGITDGAAYRTVEKAALADEGVFLDVVDAALEALNGYGKLYDPLRQILHEAASTWTVGEDNRSLMRVVGEEAQASFSRAVAPSDAVSEDLRTAWVNAYGRNGDPSDAWDHAIKALEHLLIPIVVPSKQKATLSDVVGTLRRNDGNKWRCSLPGKDESHDVAPLVGTLDLIWPNTVDRHGGNASNRPPTEAEARTVVSLAVALVQAHREAPLVYKI
ncbi:hypothetical protein QLG13_08520 [Rhodococcus aetherivorans]|uniref:hypothetical protein n=1 Tax=Rhodococcus aetherivorans TaxID=191292 RepID=UPI003EB97EDA